MFRKLMINLRSFYVRWIKGHRGRLSNKELNEKHFHFVTLQLDCMKKSVLMRKLDRVHTRVLKRKNRNRGIR